jgi:chromosome segregation ATPase
MMTDDLERRVRTLEEELNGEKYLTRYAVDQTRRNGEVLLALRNDVSAATLRLDGLAGDMAAVQSALVMHGRALDVLMQDVRQLRSGQEAINGRLDHMDGRLDGMDGRLDRMDGRLDHMDGRLERMDGRLDRMDGRLDVIERNVAAILAAIVPGSPPPA